jgi:hypothetical protein
MLVRVGHADKISVPTVSSRTERILSRFLCIIPPKALPAFQRMGCVVRDFNGPLHAGASAYNRPNSTALLSELDAASNSGDGLPRQL